ncbi:aftiphilin isoform X1 [Alligator mississippiensis]|uniref:aftiphilin isoform X1 n=1 Tax=Alligator mississippiensis TaxID=8496 RepID=UPI00071211A4|nr:aftiphilin isoform X1 [Alligator mississippiensis]
MEPDVIRMYSSSPPPLDNGADDDGDDEFGEFGGFSGSASGVGFADFDAPDYSNSKEEFIPTNHFMPLHEYSDNVGGLAAFTSVKNGKDKDCIAELSSPSKELYDISATSASKEKSKSRTSGTTFDESLENAKRTEEQRENIGKTEAFSSEGFRTDMRIRSPDQEIGACNGEKLPCLEILTNGFAALDTVNPQGTEDLDSISDSKGLKTVSTHSTELSLDSVPSPAEDFADFATFSNQETNHLEETGHKICNALNEREALNVQENNIINRVTERISVKELTSDRSCECGETFIEDEQACISEVSVVVNEIVNNYEQESTALEHDDRISSIPQAIESSTGTTEKAEDSGRRKCCDSENGKDFSRSKDFSETESIDCSKIQSSCHDPADENLLGSSEDVKNGESSSEFVSCSETNEDDFGDFGTASGTSSPFIISTQESALNGTLEESSEHSAHFSESIDEFGDFRDTNTVCQQLTKLDQSDLSQTSDTSECGVTGTHSSLDVQRTAKLANGSDSEFGDFDSVPKPQDECVIFQDSDDFADFSSAGSNQTAEWNAFEDEQKEGCSWAAFGDEQATESHHRKETWQSHRTDTSLRIDSSVTHKAESSTLTFFQETANRQPQEFAPSVQMTLQSRLERLFEACFPSIPVLEIEEEVISLNLVLEADNKQMRTGETLVNSGELVDMWKELQDIHDAYGLKYQWGGSHGNKKLLCSLGIDTRNILFTGNKKQPVIVPMYAAGLGMLEPTKEPLKPISAAEKIASLGQTPPVSPEMNTCTSDQFQESLPPVQFDWSSSGLTNPLDASGGSTLLNLDFFGPVDDSSSSSTTTIPGVDPELYELTTSKLETSNTSSKVTDAFARLMSTVEKASTSTRKPKKEEHLSEEAAKVISSLPDLSFMHAKVLMFPATLTPSTSCQEKVD